MKSRAAILAAMKAEDRAAFLDGLSPIELEQLIFDWRLWARPDQLPPDGDWRTWLLLDQGSYHSGSRACTHKSACRRYPQKRTSPSDHGTSVLCQ